MADFPDSLTRTLPDVVAQAQPSAGGLDWVGMEGIALPLQVAGPEGPMGVMARVAVSVNLLGGDRRGIHMSRLYRLLQDRLAGEAPDWPRLQVLLGEFLESHRGLSDRARLVVEFDLPVRRSALRSGLTGWRAYPVRLLAEACPGATRVELGVAVEYSSTCPGSAALARQLIQDQFVRDFPAGDPPRESLHDWLGSPAGICATPHAQRSLARVRVRVAPALAPTPLALVDRLEEALATPVQTAVRREDEQAFARLNGEHPMYCEDAARRLRQSLEGWDGIEDYAIRVAHLESLHPHDAVAIAVRGVPGGLGPESA
jgi:GTP cyclohydrolase I